MSKRTWEIRIYRSSPSKWSFTTVNPDKGSFGTSTEYVSGKRLAQAEVNKVKSSPFYNPETDLIEVKIFGATWGKNENKLSKEYTC